MLELTMVQHVVDKRSQKAPADKAASEGQSMNGNQAVVSNP